VEEETTDDSRCDSAKAEIIDPVARLSPEIDSSRSPLLHAPDGSEKLLWEPTRLTQGKPSLSRISDERNATVIDYVAPGHKAEPRILIFLRRTPVARQAALARDKYEIAS
jgi:hypothetical protein